MTVKELAGKAGFALAAGSGDREIERIYCGDLLSVVMANAPEGALWATVMAHRNIVALASLKDVACILVCGGMRPEPDTVETAAEQDVCLLTTELPVYEAVIAASEILGLIKR